VTAFNGNVYDKDWWNLAQQTSSEAPLYSAHCIKKSFVSASYMPMFTCQLWNKCAQFHIERLPTWHVTTIKFCNTSPGIQHQVT